MFTLYQKHTSDNNAVILSQSTSKNDCVSWAESLTDYLAGENDTVIRIDDTWFYLDASKTFGFILWITEKR